MIDRNEVERLLDAIERDLGRVRGEAPSLEVLRAELAALRAALREEGHPQHGLRDRLHALRGALDDALEHAIADGMTVSDYVTRIGRMLGL